MRFVLAAFVAFFVCAPAAYAGTPVVFFDNQSTVVSDEQLHAEIAAFQVMVDRDLQASWGTGAQLTDDPAFKATADMVVNIEDDADCMGCLGYHDVIGGKPTARVFARTSAEYNEAESLVTTHELEEMLVDPWINRFAIYKGRTWLVEVADPVEAGGFAYFINGVAISDFITPAWYGKGFATTRPPYDFTKGLKRAGQIGRHGYASWWDGAGWSQVFGFGIPWADRD